MIQNIEQFKKYIDGALKQEFSGWDFAYLDGRKTREDLPWDYANYIRQQIPYATSMLDMGTGGGEFLETLAPLPEKTVVTEGWSLNAPIAKKRLAPYGVEVCLIEMSIEAKHNLPFADESFDLIMNRHEAFSGKDLYRMLKPDGYFIAQAVGGDNNQRLNDLMGASLPEFHYIQLDPIVRELEQAGLTIIETQEFFPEERYFDIGAVVFYLSVIKWQIEDFSVDKYYDKLGELHNMIQRDGYLSIPSHSFFIKAKK